MLKNIRYASIGLALIASSLLARAENLYQAEQFRALVADKRAYRVGDNLTVLVYENASATATAGTSSDKSVGVNYSVVANNTNKQGALSAGDEAQGKGRIQRTGRLLAQLTVTVKTIEPSGLLAVSGEQVIAVNDETQEIKLEGKVRPSDIGENNTVISTRLSDAKISYIGEGILGDRQRPGIITRILNWLGLI
ncbi:flagellar L-ring protein precursor FlgH [Paucimonas lemoignei]|uniref:Flagellar L-ring protein FlgH n=1 Tax=Paucimonas lemoignei TaxID=29443 RepID=A0A4R3HWP9_PAULE|nr:flagellar basal body L-ring protein FlgH [Paucimonas lemoignei]TCS37716.1 flagellar L-ring protein precursor FlgH [Paucimonas lemoignei]